jgi:hypothetical protein
VIVEVPALTVEAEELVPVIETLVVSPETYDQLPASEFEFGVGNVKAPSPKVLFTLLGAVRVGAFWVTVTFAAFEVVADDITCEVVSV